MLDSIQTGNPALNDKYDYLDNMTNDDARRIFLVSLYYQNIGNDDKETWTSDIYWEQNYGETNIMMNYIQNKYYELSFDSIDYIEKKKETFMIDGHEVNSRFVVYCGDRTIYLSPSYYVLDIR